VAIHRAGVVHRDLKPANVLLGPDGPRVIDFGIARVAELSQSATGFKGTPRYTAPEVFRGGRAGPGADVWSWGAVVLFAAAGRAPVGGGSLPELMHSVLNDRPDLGALPGSLRPVVEAALAKDPGGRPSSHEVLLDLVGGSGETGPMLAQGERAAAAVRPVRPAAAPSLAEIAEAAFADLEPAAQEAVPAVLLRMVSPGEGAEDALRGVHRDEFADGRTGTGLIDQVIAAFAGAGLLAVRDDGIVSISNAALLRAWPRLREWVDAERQGLAVHHGLGDAARLWDGHGRKSSDLYQGTPLDRALAWAAAGRRHAALNVREREFLDASVALGRQRSRRRTALAAVLAVLLVLSVAATVTAVERSRTVSAQSRTVAAQRDEALSRRLASLASSMRRSDPRTARRIAIAAGRLADVKETRSELLVQVHQREAEVFRPLATVGARTLSQDGRTLVTVVDGHARLWDVDTRRQTHAFPVTCPAVEEAALSRDRRMLALRCADGRTRLWDVTGGRRLPGELDTGHQQVAGHEDMEFSPRGTYLATRGAGGTQIWVVRTRQRLLRSEVKVTGMAFSADERYLGVAAVFGVHIHDLSRNPRVPIRKLDIPDGTSLGDIAFSPDGRYFAYQRDRRVWKVAMEGDYESETDPGPDQGGIVYSSDGQYIATSRTLWREYSSKPLMSYPDDGSHCQSHRFGPGDRTLRCINITGAVVVLDISSLVAPRRLIGTEGFPLAVSDAALDRTGKVLAMRDHDDALRIWDARRRRMVGMFKPGGQLHYMPSRLRVDPGGRLMSVLLSDNRIELWDLPARRRTGTLDLSLQGGEYPADISFSPDGKSLAVLVRDRLPQKELQFWDTSSHRLIRSVTNTEDPDDPRTLIKVEQPGLVFRPDGKAVVSGGSLGVVAFPSGRRLATPNRDLTNVRAVSPDGATIVTVGFNRADLWDARTLQFTGRSLLNGKGIVEHVVFSADGRLLATGDTEGVIRIWDLESGRRYGPNLTSDRRNVTALAFSADGKTLYGVIQGESAIREVPLDPARNIAALCARTGGLTEREWRALIPEAPYRRTC
jgi:WD40 repeat protein